MDLPKISALFLAKFDVHSGYELPFSKTIDDHTYNCKNLEFKALPSGLHSLSSDTICFVDQKTGFPQVVNTVEDLVYGVSVFRQNTETQKTTLDTSTGARSVDRQSMKIFSLGILIDPEHLASGDTPDTTWKPLVYSACWKHREYLGRLLDTFITCDTEADEVKFYDQFNHYFEEHRYRQATIPTSTPYPVRIAPNDAYTLLEEPSVAPSVPLSIESLTPDHLSYGLDDLFKTLGPLLYKVWKISLLRKKIIFYSDDGGHTSSTDVAIKIEDLCRYIYSLSVISAVPKEIRSALIDSGVQNIDALEFHTPFYNLCVHDIPFLKGTSVPFIASTTDQIILEKPELYDYCVKLPATKLCEEAPEVDCVMDQSRRPATYRDFTTCEAVKEIVTTDEQSDIDTATEANDSSSSQQATSESSAHFPEYYSSLCERPSLRAMVWRGLSWWATAGESWQEDNAEFQLEKAEFHDVDVTDRVEMVIATVGYFQKLTTRLFNLLIEILANEDADESNEHARDPDVSSDTVVHRDPFADPELEGLLSHGNTNKTVWIRPQDMYEMGLDPYSQSDCEFVTDLIKLWWGRTARVNGSCQGKLCCWK